MISLIRVLIFVAIVFAVAAELAPVLVPMSLVLMGFALAKKAIS